MFEEMMAIKLGIDVHLIGKVVLANFRSFLTFSGALFVCLTHYWNYDAKPTLFDNIDDFQRLILDFAKRPESSETPIDLAVIPSVVIENLSLLPRLFR